MSFLARSSKLIAPTTVRLATRAVNSSAKQHYLKATTSSTCNYPSFPSVRTFRSSAVNMGVTEIANKAAFNDALKSHKVVIVDAFATWCGPCKIISPQIEKFSEEYSDAFFVKIDVDEVPDLAQELGIRAMPTFIFFKDGEKVNEVVGANPAAIKNAIVSLVA